MSWSDLIGGVIGSAKDSYDKTVSAEAEKEVAKQQAKVETAKASAIDGRTWMFVGIGGIVFIGLLAWVVIRRRRK